MEFIMKFKFAPHFGNIKMSVYEDDIEYTVMVKSNETGYEIVLNPTYEKFDVVGFDLLVTMDETEQRETLDRILRRLEEIGVELG